MSVTYFQPAIPTPREFIIMRLILCAASGGLDLTVRTSPFVGICMSEVRKAASALVKDGCVACEKDNSLKITGITEKGVELRIILGEDSFYPRAQHLFANFKRITPTLIISVHSQLESGGRF